MRIKISGDRKIADIQQEFNHFFPFLRLDFFGGGSEFIPEPNGKPHITTEKTIQDLGQPVKKGEITLFNEMSVSDLETIFKESFGLTVHVLRKAGYIWLETSHSDSWSLQDQNSQGERISATLIKQRDERRRF